MKTKELFEAAKTEKDREFDRLANHFLDVYWQDQLQWYEQQREELEAEGWTRTKWMIDAISDREYLHTFAEKVMNRVTVLGRRKTIALKRSPKALQK